MCSQTRVSDNPSTGNYIEINLVEFTILSHLYKYLLEKYSNKFIFALSKHDVGTHLIFRCVRSDEGTTQ